MLTACQEEEQVKPEDRLKEYVDYWNKQDFENMYPMTNDANKENFDRYKIIYDDIKVNDLTVDFQIPEPVEGEEEVKLEDLEQKTFPLQVSMETMAGPISFETEIEMVKTIEVVEEEEKINWLVNWHQGLIFPELKDGGLVNISTIEPERGQIFDRNQEGLAVTEGIYEFGIEPQLFTEGQEPEQKEAIAKVLDISIEEIDKAMNASWVQPDYFVPLKVLPNMNANLEEALSSVAPFKFQTTTGRVYPLGEAAAHLIGYVAPITAEKLEEVDRDIYSENDMIGYRGLEELFEEKLRGEKGMQITVEQEGKDSVMLAEKEVKNGENVNLTIDINVQKSIFQSLDGDAGVASAIDPPATGETLALVSSPSFDPNAFVYGLSGELWNEWQEDPKNPLLNRFSATFAPGSAFKPITSAIGLESGAIDPNEGLTINGLTWQKDGWGGNYSVRRVSESNGPVDLKDALVRSDNIYFAQQALKMGAETFTNGLKQFGIGEDFPFTYPIEASTISSDGSLDSEVLLADTSYGQGEIEMSALQLATSYSLFLNKGNMINPILLMRMKKAKHGKKIYCRRKISILFAMPYVQL